MAVRTKLLLLVSLAALAAMAIGASGAQAADSSTCAIAGNAGIANPGVQSVLTDNADGQLETDTDSGTYSFNGPAVCVRTDTDANEATNTGVYAVTVDSDGTYENEVCGTGTADDTAPSNTTFTGDLAISAAGLPGLQGPVSPTYHLDFTAGVGQLDVTGGTWDGGTLDGSGVIDIVPTDTDGNPATVPCVNEDVENFLVSGSFSASTP